MALIFIKRPMCKRGNVGFFNYCDSFGSLSICGLLTNLLVYLKSQ
uniref:Uncharacterized protein n=1 Tax=Rhizophora mucronata TaxID=61149 RepID=A0A2P2N505_RHIMU